MKGIDIGLFDLHLLNGDNIGYHWKGPNPSYSDWILFQDRITYWEDLSKIGLYKSSAGDGLSRDCASDWLQLVREDQCEHSLAERVVSVKERDFDSLTRAFAENMHYAIELQLAGMTKPGCKILRTGYIISHETRLQLEAGGFGADF